MSGKSSNLAGAVGPVWPFRQLTVNVITGGHRVLIRRALALGLCCIVCGRVFHRAAIGLRHPPLGGNLGVGIGHQMLYGGHRIAVEGLIEGSATARASGDRSVSLSSMKWR